MNKLLSETVQQAIRCPNCRCVLLPGQDHLKCHNQGCGSSFPLIKGIPVLINERNSLFSISDFLSQKETFFRKTAPHPVKSFLGRFIPGISNNLCAERNYALLADLLLRSSTAPRVLILGGSVSGRGISALLSDSRIECVETDVSLGERAQMICDAHDIPFVDGTFSGVVVQAVLEHVVDPFRCVAEIHRVLAPGGLVYAETPFIQQVHGGKYDFQRFTFLGHRRLFRSFSEIKSGMACGPGMALAWSYQYFLTSFASTELFRRFLGYFARFTSFFLKYADNFLARRNSAFNAASGFYFLGKKAEHPLPDKDLLSGFRG